MKSNGLKSKKKNNSMRLAKRVFYYRLYYKGVFCRSLLVTLLFGIILLSVPFVKYIHILSKVFFFGGLLCDFAYRNLFCKDDFYFYRNGSCCVTELCIVSFVCSLIIVLVLSNITIGIWECI